MLIEKGDQVRFTVAGKELVGTVAVVKLLVQWEENFMWIESGEVRKV